MAKNGKSNSLIDFGDEDSIEVSKPKKIKRSTSKTKKNAENDYSNYSLTLLQFGSSEYINTASLEYSLSTLERGLVGIDGLKASQRKAIFTLSKISGEIKTISCAGRMISDEIYLHGDASAAGTLQQLASPVANNYPLIGKRGGFGTQANPEPASPRYTYVKKNKVTEQLVLCDMDIVPMKDNYDGSTQEPRFFLPLIPLSLLGSNGLSVAYKSVILPYKLEDIIDNCIRVIEGKKQKEMVPSFCSVGANDKVLKLDDKKYQFFGKIDIVDDSTVRVRGLPPAYKLETFRQKLINMQDNNDIKYFVDDTTKNVDITIRLPRGRAITWGEDDALEFFDLNKQITESIIILNEHGKVSLYDSPNDVIKHYVSHRYGFYIKRYEQMLRNAEAKLRSLELVKECFDNDIMSKVKSFKNRSEMHNFISSLNKKIGAAPESVENILNYASYRWTLDNLDKVNADIDAIMKDISTYKDLLDNKEKIWDVYKKELKELTKIKFENDDDDE